MDGDTDGLLMDDAEEEGVLPVEDESEEDELGLMGMHTVDDADELSDFSV